MKLLRWISIFGALMLMFGELYRSWGTGRPLPFVLDDMFAGMLMLWAVHMTRRPSAVGRRFLAAAWGVAAGMLYGSFFGKLIDPVDSVPGNFSIGFLTAIVGFAFAVSIIGLIASIMLPDDVGEGS
jgi:hypothetical protein